MRERLQTMLWAALLISLPVTSFQYFPGGFGGRVQVAPLALYPLSALVLVGVLPALWEKRLPRVLLPLWAFVGVVAISLALSFSEPIQPLFGVTQVSRTVRAVLALGMGIAFYLAFALVPTTLPDLRRSLRWLYAGFAVAFVWGTLQATQVIAFYRPLFVWIRDTHEIFFAGKLFRTRISGMALEPSWFAEQIVFLLLPWLFASVLTDSTVFRWRWRRVTVEALMAAWGVVLLIFTYSRVGLVGMLGLVGLSVLLYRPARTSEKVFSWRRLGTAVGIIAGLLVVVLIAGSQNNYFSRMWRFFSDEERIGNYWSYIAFGQRFLYWETAFNIYEENPLTGVGIGNYAFFVEDAFPDVPLFVYPEALGYMIPREGRANLLTPKGLFPKIIAETGLFGLGTFLAFVVMVGGYVFYLWRSPDPEEHFWGAGGILGGAAFVLFAFSTDSFALPNMWMYFGLITAAFRLASKTV